MQRLLQAVAAALIVGVLGSALVMPAHAGYGNHAERATANIQTKVGLAKIRIELELAEIKAVAESKVPAP